MTIHHLPFAHTGQTVFSHDLESYVLVLAGAIGGDTQYAGDLLPAAGLVTSSEDYYPTVAINALMRNLRDPAMSSHHPQVIRSLFYIFQALHLGSVPYLPKVWV